MTLTTQRLSSHACPECGLANFPIKGARQVFCRPAHSLAWHNREKGRSSAVAVAMAWRQKRGTGDVAKAALAKLCQLLDAYNAEDFAAGRMSASDYQSVVARLGHNVSACDRRAKRR